MNQTLGQGSFGWVTLVREISNGKLFAMKSVRLDLDYRLKNQNCSNIAP